MKKLLLLGIALSGLFCAAGQTARAGDDGPAYSEDRPAPRYYEGRVVAPRCYLPPPPVYDAPAPAVVFYNGPRYYHRRRHFYPDGYGYGGYPYRCAPGVHIGIGF